MAGAGVTTPTAARATLPVLRALLDQARRKDFASGVLGVRARPEWSGAPAFTHADVPVRVIGSAAIATLSFAVQIDAGHGSFSAILVRVAIVASFFVAGFTMKAAFMRLRGGKVKGDRISLGEWLASPARATGLWRWKNAWGEPSTSAARQRYMVLLYVIALAQSDPRVGKRPLRWRRGLPVTLRYELSTGLLPEAFAAGEGEWRDAAWAHVSAQLSLLPPVQSGSTDERTSGDSDERAGRDTDERSSGDTDERKTGDTDRSTWPEPKDIDPQVLARMVRTAIGRWERTHDDGKPLPALQLERHIKVRMSRKTAADLLATGYAAVGQRKSGAQ